jgi:hypothetical protein
MTEDASGQFEAMFLRESAFASIPRDTPGTIFTVDEMKNIVRTFEVGRLSGDEGYAEAIGQLYCESSQKLRGQTRGAFRRAAVSPKPAAAFCWNGRTETTECDSTLRLTTATQMVMQRKNSLPGQHQ